MNKTLTIMLTLLVGLVVGDQCPFISTWHGNFVVNGDVTGCNATLNGMRVNVMDLETIRGYGLLHVRCLACTFSVVSTFESCDDCIICTHNEGIQRCHSIVVPVILSSVVTIIVVTTMLICCLKLDKKINMYSCISRRWQARSDYKRIKRVEKLRPIIETELGKLTLNHHTDLNPENHSKASPLKNDEVVKPSKSSRPPSPTPSMIMAALLLSAGQVKACDDTLMMSSEGVVLFNQHTSTYNTGLFAVHSGATLCFKYPDGNKESLKLNAISRILDYKPMYRACSFNISTVSTYNCAWAGECWDETTCHKGYVKDTLRGDQSISPNEHYDCEMVPNSSQSHCTHEQICVWYRWAVIPNQEICDGVLSLSNIAVELSFEYTSRTGNVISFSISPNDPQVDTPLPLHLINYMISSPNDAPNLRLHNGQFYKTRACDLNSPSPGLLGDMQVGFEGEESVYPEWAVQCRADGSRATCTTSEPGYFRSLQMDLRYPVTPHHVTGGFVRLKESERGSASLMFRTELNPTLFVEQASCALRVDYTYGCTGCKDNPFIIVTPFDISVTGIMRFKSNCTFYLAEVECFPKTQKIQLMGNPDSCSIKAPGTNSTIVAAINYEFRGEIFSMGLVTYRSEETLSEKLTLGIQSPEFLSSLKISLGAGALLTVATTLIKSAMRYAAYKAGKTEVAPE